MSSGAWTTDHELSFLQKLGRFAPLVTTPRRELLQSYAQSLELRRDWDGMDQYRVKSAVKRHLAEVK